MLTVVFTHGAPFWINLTFPSSSAFVVVAIAFHFSIHCDLHKVSLFVYPSSQLSSISLSNEIAAGLFSRLRDMVVCYILSKQAIKCSVLSHRWRFLYTQIPQLTIFPPRFLSDDHNEEEVRFKSFRLNSVVNATLENIISNILLKHSSDLEAFHLYDDCKFSYQNVWKWFNIVQHCHCV